MLLKDFSPGLERYWSEKNAVAFDEVLKGSRYSPIWICGLGHEWSTRLSNIVKKPVDKVNCPFCSNRKVLPGFNDVATTHPELVEQWDVENNILSPDDVTIGARDKINWKCSFEHKWVASLVNRKNGTGCPECYTISRASDKPKPTPRASKPLPDYLVEEWHPTKNVVEVNTATQGSGVKAWWVCSLGHEWEARVGNRKKNGCPVCAGYQVLQGFNDLGTLHPELVGEWCLDRNVLLPSDVTSGSSQRAWWKCDNQHSWSAPVYKRTISKQGCPVCVGSSPERELFDFVSSLPVGDVISNTRAVIAPYELDIYIPDRKVAVEFNGVYWHTEQQGKDKWYHHSKWKACKEAGIQLIQVWEDDWNRNPDLVKRMLAHKLGVSEQRKLAARDTRVVLLSQVQVDEFLDANHIQGTVGGGIRLGLVEKGNTGSIVAVMLLKREPGGEGKTLNLLRFATSENVRGGFMKLLTYVERAFNSVSIITFSDNCVSDGGLYEGNGFVAVKELAPDYMYLVRGVRVHKFGYRLKRFKSDPGLNYEEGLTERELAELNNLSRVWDAGKTKWVKTFV